MEFNPLMLIPLLMKNKGDNTQDMSKMLEMMNALQSQNKNDAIMNMLGVDENTKQMINMMSGQNISTKSEDVKTECQTPTFISPNINEALNKIMKNKG